MTPTATTSDAAVKAPILLVGHANVGKSVLFGLLTGEYAWVSNYPGTTVEVARGRSTYGTRREVLDTPGVNSLSADSEDERVALEILTRETAGVVVQVADARNLPRALSLTLQLSDLARPLVLVLNFMDEAESVGMKFNLARLEELLGCEVVPMVAVEGRGFPQLKRAIERARIPRVAYAEGTEAREHACAAIMCAASALCGANGNGRSTAAGHASALNPDAELTQIAVTSANGKGSGLHETSVLQPAATRLVAHVPGTTGWQARERWLAAQLPGVWSAKPDGRLRWSDQIDAWLRYFPTGFAVMLAVGALLYVAIGIGAGAVSDFLTQRVFAGILTPWLGAQLARLHFPALTDFVVGPYGLFSTGLSYSLGLVLPVLASFFLLFALLEDSGYLPRLAVLWHRAMERVGLSGKAVVPMILGLGCGTTAVVATRILPSRRERILAALLLAVGVPCSAQLGVLMGLVSGLSFWVPLGITIVVLFQVLWIGKVASRLLPGATPDFILELPPLRLPRISNLLHKTALRVGWYLKEAIPIFLFGSVLLFVLDRLHAIDYLIGAARPVVAGWLGLPAGTSIAFVMGFLRRDYGAAGIYALARSGQMSTAQIMVACTTMVLFMPCLANFLMLVKEFGTRVAVRIALVTAGVALVVGGALRLALAVM